MKVWVGCIGLTGGGGVGLGAGGTGVATLVAIMFFNLSISSGVAARSRFASSFFGVLSSTRETAGGGGALGAFVNPTSSLIFLGTLGNTLLRASLNCKFSPPDFFCISLLMKTFLILTH